MTNIDIYPIGKVSIEVSRSNPSKMKSNPKISKLIIFEEYEDSLDGIEEYSHIIICYWAHLISEKERKLRKVHPRGNKNRAKRGIFSTRSPVRPNPILLTTVELIQRKDNILLVKKLDALDNSPILDIKPYVNHFDSP